VYGFSEKDVLIINTLNAAITELASEDKKVTPYYFSNFKPI
jgi:hypothetical protein